MRTNPETEKVNALLKRDEAMREQMIALAKGCLIAAESDSEAAAGQMAITLRAIIAFDPDDLANLPFTARVNKTLERVDWDAIAASWIAECS